MIEYHIIVSNNQLHIKIQRLHIFVDEIAFHSFLDSN